jgi:hypothetical protein
LDARHVGAAAQHRIAEKLVEQHAGRRTDGMRGCASATSPKPSPNSIRQRREIVEAADFYRTGGRRRECRDHRLEWIIVQAG